MGFQAAKQPIKRTEWNGMDTIYDGAWRNNNNRILFWKGNDDKKRKFEKGAEKKE